MKSKQQRQFGVEKGEVLIFAKSSQMPSFGNLEIIDCAAGDIVVCIDVFPVEGLELYSENKCIVLHSTGLCYFSFQYCLNKTAWKGTFVGK